MLQDIRNVSKVSKSSSSTELRVEISPDSLARQENVIASIPAMVVTISTVKVHSNPAICSFHNPLASFEPRTHTLLNEIEDARLQHPTQTVLGKPIHAVQQELMPLLSG